MKRLLHLASALLLGAALASGCATTGATDMKAANCRNGCTEAADSCTISCVRQMGAGSKETCETNCGKAKQRCVSDCLDR